MKKEEKKEEELSPSLMPQLTLTLLAEKPPAKKERRRKKIGKNFRKAVLGTAAGLLALLAGWSLQAQQTGVPRLINFQSVLTDAGGTPLPDGLHEVNFRILTPQGEVLYEEKQNVESYKGVASAMVGSQGGLPQAALSPETPKFLGVRIPGEGAEILLEVVSVPYALYAEEALSVKARSIGTEAIRPRSITAELLAEGVLSQWFAALTPAQFPASLVTQNQFAVAEGNIQNLNVTLREETLRRQTDIVTLHTILDQLSVSLRNLEGNVAAPVAQEPKVVAAGIVDYQGEFDANLRNGYNIDAVLSKLEADGTQRSFEANPGAAGIYFQTPIELPYYVQATSLGSPNEMYIRASRNDRVVIECPNDRDMNSFHFVVFK